MTGQCKYLMPKNKPGVALGDTDMSGHEALAGMA